MKKLIYISVILLIATNAIAQNQRFNPLGKTQIHNQFLKNLLKQQGDLSIAEKTASLKERLIGSSLYIISPDSTVRTDTMAYTYSGSRGSKFDLSFFEIATPFDDEQPMVNIETNLSSGIRFHNNQQLVQCDTFRDWNSYSDVPSGIFNETDAKYDSNNNLIDYNYIINNVNYFSYKYHNVYNSNNLVTFNSKFYSAKDSAYNRYFRYNSSNQLIQDSIVEYYYDSAAIKDILNYVYGYDSIGNINSVGSYFEFPSVHKAYKLTNYMMTYYDDNRLKTFMDSAAHEYDSFTYSPGFNYPTNIYLFYYPSPSSPATLYNTISYHLNKSNVPDTVIATYSKDTAKATIIYDSYNNPITATSIEKNDTFPSFLYITYYYYETYTATQVPTISQNTDNIKIYPKPATNQVYINMADAAKNRQVFVNLINTNGQLIRTESVPPNSQVWQTSVANLAPGTYFISICDRPGNKLHSQAIVKQ